MERGKAVATNSVSYRMFRAGSFTPWEELFDEVSRFASDTGPERLIGISQSEDSKAAVVTVWYWQDPVK